MNSRIGYIFFFILFSKSIYSQSQKASDLLDIADSIYYADPDKSCKLCLDAYKLAGVEADFMSRADAQVCLARYYLLKSDYIKTKKYIERSIQEYKNLRGKDESKIKDRLGIAYNLYSILYFRLGEDQKSYDYQNEAIRLFKENGNIQGMIHIMTNLSNSYIKDKRLEQAQTLLDEIYSYKDRMSQTALYFYQQNMGLLRMEQGNYNEALSWFVKALKTAQTQAMRDSEITVMTLTGKTYALIGNYGKANAILKKAEKLAIAQNLEYELNEVYRQQVSILKQQGQNDEAMVIEAKLVKLESSVHQEVFSAKAKKDSLAIILENKKRELQIKEAQLRASHQKSTRTKFLFIPLIGGLVIGLAIFLFMRYRTNSSKK